jgi:hypothetical protein
MTTQIVTLLGKWLLSLPWVRPCMKSWVNIQAKDPSPLSPPFWGTLSTTRICDAQKSIWYKLLPPPLKATRPTKEALRNILNSTQSGSAETRTMSAKRLQGSSPDSPQIPFRGE